jgi:hypothetical protein
VTATYYLALDNLIDRSGFSQKALLSTVRTHGPKQTMTLRLSIRRKFKEHFLVPPPAHNKRYMNLDKHLFKYIAKRDLFLDRENIHNYY